MIQRLKFVFFSLVVAGAAWLTPAARADEWDKETILTFNEPVEIPGKVLPAGTYVFKLANSETERNMVQIFTEDQQHLLSTVMAIPDSRMEPADKTIVTFEERPSGSPEALHSWFYPGDTEGLQFVYSNAEKQFVKPVSTALEAAIPAPKIVMIETPEEQPFEETTEPLIVREEKTYCLRRRCRRRPTMLRLFRTTARRRLLQTHFRKRRATSG